MNLIKSHIADRLSQAVELNQSEIYALFEIPPDDSLGDLAFPCFILSKKLKKSPNIIARDLSAAIAPDSFIASVSANGPYLNFFINRVNFAMDIINKIQSASSRYGSSTLGQNKTIVMDYSSPNIAKPFGIGHLRSTVIGAALKRIFEFQGYKVIGVNHLGDWGTQFGKLITAYKLWGDPARLAAQPIDHLFELYVKIHQEEEKEKKGSGESSLEQQTRDEFKKLESGNKENLELWKKFSELSWLEFTSIYEMLGVKFESKAGESFYNDKMEVVVETLKNKKLLSTSRDAQIVDLEKFSMPPLLIKKGDGTSLYATRDLAAAIFRKQEYNFDKSLYIVGVAQSLHFQQLFKTLELMGYEWAKDCRHVSFGWVKLGDEMMSTRMGNIVFLKEVIDRTIELAASIIAKNSTDIEEPKRVAFQVGVGAVIFAQLGFRRDTDISFEWDRMLAFDGNTGPYLQYTHARICSVLRKYDRPLPSTFNPEMLKLAEEHQIIKKLGLFPDIIDRAADECEPYIISSFLLDICGIFNTYYQKYRSSDDRILSSDKAKAEARLILIDALKSVLNSGLKLLGLYPIEKM